MPQRIPWYTAPESANNIEFPPNPQTCPASRAPGTSCFVQEAHAARRPHVGATGRRPVGYEFRTERSTPTALAVSSFVASVHSLASRVSMGMSAGLDSPFRIFTAIWPAL